MGQSSSQPATQLAAQPEVSGKPEKRKKIKKRKEKKRADSGEHAQEEEIAQALLEMKGSQAVDLSAHGDEDDIAAANQLLAESSPARRGTSTMFDRDAGLLQEKEKVKTKRKTKKTSKLRKDRNEALDEGGNPYSYVEDLVEGGSHGAENHANGSPRAQQDRVSSQPVAILDDINSNDEETARHLREFDGQLSIAEPTVPASHTQHSPENDATVRIVTPRHGDDHSYDDVMHIGYSLPVHQYQSPTDRRSKKRKRKTQQGSTDSTAGITTSLDQGSAAFNGAVQKALAHGRQTNGSISTHHSDTVLAVDSDNVTETANQRNMSPDLYHIPQDDVLPGIEDPTSPSHRRCRKRQRQQHDNAVAVNGDEYPRIHPLFSKGQEHEGHGNSRQEVREPVKKASLKHKRRLPVVDNHDLGSSRPKKKAKSVDYKTEQVRRASPSQVSNLGAEARKEGPYTDAEIAKLCSFRDEYCEENDLTPEQFNDKVHASAHNNVTNINFWNDVSDVLPYRTRHSIQRLCRRRFHNFTKRGKWTAEEDDELRQAHEQHGNKWKVIGDQIERMPEDCRDRWRNYLKDDEYRNRDMWTEYEVECLREAVAQCMDAMREANREQMERDGYGRDPPEQPDEEEKDMINWGIVSAKLGGSRSRLQCSYKWKWLQEDFLRKMKEPDKKLKKVVARGPKKLNAWRAKRAEKKYPFMLPGDKYDLLDALSQLGVNDDSGISWRYIGQKSYRAVWTAAVSRYAYFEMKKTIPKAETMTFSEVVATLKENLEKEHADELDTHWVPPPEDLVSKDSKKKSKKPELSKETVAASDVDDDDDDDDTTNNNIANGHSKTNTNIKAHEHPTHNDPTTAQEKSTSDTESDTHTHTPTPEIPTSSDEDEPDPEVPDSEQDQPETHMRDDDIDEKLARQLELLHDA